MKVILQKLTIENFKGIVRWEGEFDEDITKIIGAKGTGKTSLADAFGWLIDEKSSDGRQDSGKSSFEITPLQDDNKRKEGLTTMVEAVLLVGSETHRLKKTHFEKFVKGVFKGFDRGRWIDDVPMTATEFNDFVLKNLPNFRLLSDMRNFNERLSWQDRRKEVIAFSGETPVPPGFDDLLTACEGRPVDKFKKVMRDRYSALDTQHKGIQPRIDENERKLSQYEDGDVSILEARRDSIKSMIEKVNGERQAIRDKESDRQKQIDACNELRKKLNDREGQLAKDISGIKKALDEKGEISLKISEKTDAIVDLKGEVATAAADIGAKERRLSILLENREDIRKRYRSVESADKCPECGKSAVIKTVCSNCDHVYKVQEVYKDKDLELKKITSEGTAVQDEIEQTKAALTKDQKAHQEAQAKLKEAQEELEAMKEASNARICELDEQIAGHKTPDPDNDPQWQKLAAELKAATESIRQPVTEQLTELDEKHKSLAEELEKVNKALNSHDSIVEIKGRIKELEAERKDLAQQMATTQAMLDRIDEYAEAESRLVEKAVNGKFKYVTWKLFGEFLNGNADPCCIAMIGGRPYSEASSGERLLMNNDILNTLSEHYDCYYPRFIDDFVLIGEDLDTNTQTIRLITDKNVTKLKVG